MRRCLSPGRGSSTPQHPVSVSQNRYRGPDSAHSRSPVRVPPSSPRLDSHGCPEQAPSSAQKAWLVLPRPIQELGKSTLNLRLLPAPASPSPKRAVVPPKRLLSGRDPP